ncbi:hypothetical protein [Thalassococcus lentus]|uniref:Uncharacterized protein n=1 Tax=Thalassococcus lentus TaxID=1210524 RepID=A0ABT4XSV4_9RHOB|nr:hypothetical protein [Thalassococcus lentus]MDA7425046.1 hypothetical protein [Thalassococcus lentus]
MQNNPYLLLFGLFFALYLGGQSWQRRRVKRAARDLPTRMQRLLGPEPEFAPPEDVPEALQDYANLHRRAGRIKLCVWGLAFVWLAYAAFLVLRKQFS